MNDKIKTYSDDFLKRVDLDNGDYVEVEPFAELSGSGMGGGASKSGAKEDPNSIRSAATARVLLAYSVGESQGLVDGAKSIYFDQTPLQSATSEYNFQGVRWEQRYGLPSQPYVSGFEQATNLVQVGTQITKSTSGGPGPVIRTVTDRDVDAVRVTIGVPQLQFVDKKSGDQRGSQIQLQMHVRDPVVGVWEDRGVKTITGKATGGFQVQYRVEKPAVVNAAWDIRVTRLTDDSDSNYLNNDTNFDAFVEVNDGHQTYPDVAYVAVEVDTEMFGNSIPNISLKVNGVKVQVPSNYNETNPDAPFYSGTWNGTFKWAATSNPAWHLYNMILNSKYGLDIPQAYLDKYSFYTIAQYCDAVNPATGAYLGIDNGNGGVRRRFTLNTQIAGQEEALTLLQNIASSFRGLTYYGAGAVVAAQDSPKSTSAIITNENVENGRFVYASAEARNRTTIANITYNDKDYFYRTDIATYPPQSEWATNPGIARYGKNAFDGVKFGCNNRAEAYAFAKWIVYSSQSETDTVQFNVGPEHSVLRPGEVVEIYDRRYTKERFGGRLDAGSTTTSIKLDAPVKLNAGQTYTIKLVKPDGKTLETKTISTGAGTWSTVTVSSAFSFTPVTDYTWAITGTDIAPRKFRIINIVKSTLLSYEVFAMFYDETKYLAVENNIYITPEPFVRRDLSQISPPTNVTWEQRGTVDPVLGTANRLFVKWTKSTSDYVTRYRVMHRFAEGLWTPLGYTNIPELEISNVRPGKHEVQVYAENIAGLSSIAAVSTYTFGYGGDSAFQAPISLTVKGGGTTFDGKDLTFTWVRHPSNEALGLASAGYVIEIKVDGVLVRTATIPGLEYIYYYDDMVSDQGTPPSRSVVVTVAEVDTYQRMSPTIEATFTNPAPLPVNVELLGGFNKIILNLVASEETDVVGYQIFRSATSAFTASLANRVYKGPSNQFSDEGLEDATRYYYRIACYDLFDDSIAGLILSSEVNQITADGNIDVVAPAVPTGLALSTNTVNGVVSLTATWNNLTAETYTAYEVAISEVNNTSFVGGFLTGINSYTFTSVKPNRLYYVKVRAKNGIKDSAYSSIVSVTTPYASGVPSEVIAVGAPTGLTAAASFRSIDLSWTEGTGTVTSTEIFMGTVNNITSAIKIGEVAQGTKDFLVGALTSATTYYFWIRHVGPLGTGSYNTGNTSGTTATTVTTGTADYQDLSIVNAKIADTTIDSAKIVSLNANKIQAGSVLAGTVLVGSTPLANVVTDSALGAQNPATRINANTTLIDPGKILISGATTLASWRNGGDNTKIEGGNIATNTISANQIKIGLRGVTFEGVDFEPNKATGLVSWTAGGITYINDAGTAVRVAIAAGATTTVATSGVPVFIYWVKDATALASTTARLTAFAADNIVVASYIGGVDLVVNYGGTIIDGDQIRAGTIKGDRIEANSIGAGQVTTGELITSSAQIRSAIINTAHIGNAQITNAKIGDAQITTAKIADAQITNAKIGIAEIDTLRLKNGSVSSIVIINAGSTSGIQANGTGSQVGALSLGSNITIPSPAGQGGPFKSNFQLTVQFAKSQTLRSEMSFFVALAIWNGSGWDDAIHRYGGIGTQSTENSMVFSFGLDTYPGQIWTIRRVEVTCRNIDSATMNYRIGPMSMVAITVLK